MQETPRDSGKRGLHRPGHDAHPTLHPERTHLFTPAHHATEFLPPPASESPRSSLDKRCRLQPLPPSPHVLSSFLPSYKDTGHVGPRAHPVLVDPVSNSDHFLSAWRSERQHVSLLGAIHPRIPGWGPTCQRASHFLSGSTFLQSCPSELVEMPPAPAGDARCGQV